MVEVEIKFHAPDKPGIEQKLQAMGASFVIEREECDQYFNAPDREFARTDEALRIRQVGGEVKLTYKGPKRDALTKTRTEIEVALANEDRSADDLAAILRCLGYRPVHFVTKNRRVFRLKQGEFDVEVCLDEVAGVGAYVELEIVVAEDLVEQARAVVLRLAKELGLASPERRSYLEMALAQGGSKS